MADIHNIPFLRRKSRRKPSERRDTECLAQRQEVAVTASINLAALQRSSRILMGFLLSFSLSTPCLPAPNAPSYPVIWPDTFLARVEIWALIETLNAELLTAHSATLILDKWCRDHKLAPEARIAAQRIAIEPKPLTDEQRKILRISSKDKVQYRRVALHCGDVVLSEAENWYVPDRLTPTMNTILETTDTAFGRVVQPLSPQRRTLSSRILWHPLPDGWEMEEPASISSEEGIHGHGATSLVIPEHLLEHQAVLTTATDEPFAMVIETYTNRILDFNPKRNTP